MPEERAHKTWLHSDRAIPARFVRPLLRFTHIEASGGFVLLAATIVALLWANAPFGESYAEVWDTHITFEIGSLHIDESMRELVNDGLMAVFFFVVGLEIKRELVLGDLREPRAAALPAVAALGGMVVPALIYLFFVGGGEASRGWGIPMATDIAFSIGVVSLLGRRVPTAAKLFLLALAIVDDIGAIAVIAVFYTEALHVGWLAAAIGGLAVTYLAQRVGVRAIAFYAVVAVLSWFFLLESGVHATLAGVAFGLLTPARSMYGDEAYHRRAGWILSRYDMEARSPRGDERIDHDALELSRVARESVSPLNRLEEALHPWSSFLIVPVFALANAGIRFADIDVWEAASSSVALGVGVGLVAGKFFGVGLATWLAVRLGLGSLPRHTTWPQVWGVGALAGIGFTVSLFVTGLAFGDPVITDQAKIGIFVGSTVAGVLGYAILRGFSPAAPSAGEDPAVLDSRATIHHSE